MIYVSRTRRSTAAPGGFGALMISDQSRAELLEFAEGLGLQTRWVHLQPYPHFELAPRFRTLAVERGAGELRGRGDLGAALNRLSRSEHAALERHRKWLAAGPGRGAPPA